MHKAIPTGSVLVGGSVFYLDCFGYANAYTNLSHNVSRTNTSTGETRATRRISSWECLGCSLDPSASGDLFPRKSSRHVQPEALVGESTGESAPKHRWISCRSSEPENITRIFGETHRCQGPSIGDLKPLQKTSEPLLRIWQADPTMAALVELAT